MFAILSTFTYAGSFIEPSGAEKVDIQNVPTVNNKKLDGYGYGMPSMQGMYGMPMMAGGINSPAPGALQKSATWIKRIVGLIPDKDIQNGIKAYIEIVNPSAYSGDSVGGQNAGVSGYFTKNFTQNSCFQKSSIAFYGDVAAYLSKKNQCSEKEKESLVFFLKSKVNPVFGCSKRASVLDVTSPGETGWLYNLAMKHAGQNPEAAMALIGLCGHDDINQGTFGYLDSSEAAKAQIQEQIRSMKEQKSKIDVELKKAFSSFDKDHQQVYDMSRKAGKLAENISLMGETKSLPKTMDCPPQTSGFYTPQSLAPAADISSDLKSEIVRIQGANLSDKTQIPAKHYHVYGSAFLGCKMAMQGMKPEHAVFVQKEAARFYRGLRMCESAEIQMGTVSPITLESVKLIIPNVDVKGDVPTQIMKIFDSVGTKKIDCFNLGTLKMERDDSKLRAYHNSCMLLEQFGIRLLTAEERKEAVFKVEKGIERNDAANLYKKWYASVGKVCSDIRYGGPLDIAKPDSFLSKFAKPNDWSQERYSAALKRLQTWELDFKWTLAQHEAGSSFGAKKCAEAKANGKVNPFKSPNCEMEPQQIISGSIFGYPTGDFYNYTKQAIKNVIETESKSQQPSIVPADSIKAKSKTAN